MKSLRYVIYTTLNRKTRISHAPWTNGLVKGMNRSLQEYLRCIINRNDAKYTGWSTDVKLFLLAYNSQITKTLGISPYEMVFYQKLRKLILFTANSSKNTRGYCEPTKESICYNLSLHTHNEYHFHHPQILKLISGSHTKWILSRDEKQYEIYQKMAKKTITKTECSVPNKFTIHTSYKPKNRNVCLYPNICNTETNI